MEIDIKKEEQKKFRAELRSEEVDEVLNNIPAWIIRWGITVLFITVLILLIGSYFFKYPVVVQAQITITTAEPPANVIARSSGKIDQILVVNDQHIEEGATLAIIQNPAFTVDLLELSKLMKEIEIKKYSASQIYELMKSRSFNLGNLQPVYNLFLNSANDYANYLKLNYHQHKIISQKQQLNIQKEYYSEMLKQLPLAGKSHQASNTIFKRDSILFTRRIISANEYDISSRSHIESQRSYLNFQSTLKQQELQLQKQEESLLDLEKEAFEQASQYQLSFQNALKELMAQIHNWDQNFLLKSPVKGKVHILGAWSKNQNVIEGETVFVVTPDEAVVPRGKALLPIQGAGKVKINQLANIRINNFPDREYGYLKGRVKSVSNTHTTDGFYVLEIELLNGMKTNYGKVFPVELEQVGVADIITEEQRLLERIILPLKQLVSQQNERF